MSLIGDIIDRVLFPNREIHVIPVLDGAFSPNQRLDQARQLGDEIERPDDLALGPDGALYVSTRHRDPALRRRRTSTSASDIRRFRSSGRRARLDGDGRLLACVSKQGLVALSPTGEVVGKLERAGGERNRLSDSRSTVAPDGTIYADRRIARQSARTLARRSDAEPRAVGAADRLQLRA